MKTAAILSALAGVVTVTTALSMARDDGAARAAAVPSLATEDYGRRLIAETSRLMGPDHPDPAKRYTGIRMACASCHLGAGTEPGTLSLLQSAAVYPRFSGRDGGASDRESPRSIAYHSRCAVDELLGAAH